MGYKSLRAAVEDLETHRQLVRVTETVDPNLEMAEIQRRAYAAGAPAMPPWTAGRARTTVPRRWRRSTRP